MEAARWIRGLAPLAVLAVLAGSGLGRAPALGAAAPPWQPPPCPDPAPTTTQRAQPADAAWYRLRSVLDDSGTLAAWQLRFGEAGQGFRVLDLPPESFASGPVDGRLVVGDDDGSVSRLRLLDVARACVVAAATETDVIRSAVLAPDGRSIAEHRVNREQRTDLGVWERTQDLGPATRVLDGLAPDDRYGPTFSTELHWTGGLLGVASCGELACRGRILDPATGQITSTDGTGPLIGAIPGAVIAYDVCHGFPCPILAIEPETGRRTILVADAGPALLSAGDGGVLVLAARDGGLETVDIRSGDHRTVAGSSGLMPVHDGSLATSGLEVPAGDVVAAPGGLVDDPARSRAIRPATATIEPAGEAVP